MQTDLQQQRAVKQKNGQGCKQRQALNSFLTARLHICTPSHQLSVLLSVCQSFDLCIWVVFTVLQRECRADTLQLRWRKIKLSQAKEKAEQVKVMQATADWRLVMLYRVPLRHVTTCPYIHSKHHTWWRPPRCYHKAAGFDSQLWSSSLPS